MKRKRAKWLIIPLLLVLAAAALPAVSRTDPAPAEAPADPNPNAPYPAIEPLPFAGEKLTYEFGWNGIAAAEADVSVEEIDYNGVPVYHARIDIRSRPAIDWIWKVRDRLEVYTNRADLRPQRYTFLQREGKYHHDTDIVFDHARGTATSIRSYKGKVKTKQIVFAEMYDPLTALLVLRGRPLAVGQSHEFEVFDGKRVHQIRYEAVKKEKIRTGDGKVETIKVVPSIVWTKPPIERKESDKVARVNEIYVWLEPGDEARIVKIESEVTVGSIYAKLVSD